MTYLALQALKVVSMTVIQIELIDPRARKLLADLAEMNLIKIQELGSVEERFAALLQRLRSSEETFTLEEITKEVEAVRAIRATPDGSAH
jgi:hypothetical protein